MTDILQQAKNIDQEAGDRWEVVHVLAQYSDSNEFIDKAVAALASEKYVWSVQVFMGGRWIFMVTLNTGNSLEEAAKWFPSRERAEYFASLWEPDSPARVVKRRVSPVVVDG